MPSQIVYRYRHQVKVYPDCPPGIRFTPNGSYSVTVKLPSGSLFTKYFQDVNLAVYYKTFGCDKPTTQSLPETESIFGEIDRLAS